MSVRDIAKHAGVNHGQIHHYFSNKRGLLKAAIRQLAREHREYHANIGLDEQHVPVPLTLSDTQNYVMAIVRCIIDDDMELATLEIKDGNSIPRNILQARAEEFSSPQALADFKAALAVSVALEWSWATLGPYISHLVNLQPDEEPTVLAAFSKASRMFLNNTELLKDPE